MRFTTARLCGGKALMAVSSEELDIDPVRAAGILEGRGFQVTQADDMMAVFQWNGMEVTLYRQGKVMFFPLEDRNACISYATGILESLRRREAHHNDKDGPLISRHMEPAYLVIAAVVISAVLSWEAYKLNNLTRDGAVASFAVGAFVGVFSSINAFFLLTVFTIAGFVATMRDIERKRAQGLQEGQLGERTWKNVLGVGLPPCLVVALHFLSIIDDTMFAVMFISTITVAGADTIASEIGVKDPKVYMITTGERVEPGINGGISVLGTGVSTVASLLIAILGWFVITESLDWLLLIPFAAGVLGNLLDSFFGALLENRGLISKYVNNCSTALIGAFVALLLYLLVRYRGL